MAKSPVAGQVKRRLAAEIGSTPAINFYRTCLSHTLLRLGKDPRWRTYLAVAPDRDLRSPPWSRLANASLVRVSQGAGDLGMRMERLFRLLPPGPAIIVGSDIPAISAAGVARAFRQLGQADAVLGPAPDGGYWLVGLRRTPRRLSPFAGVRWSSDKALPDTLCNLKGRRVAFAATLADVDEEKTWRGSRGLWQRLIQPRVR